MVQDLPVSVWSLQDQKLSIPVEWLEMTGGLAVSVLQ